MQVILEELIAKIEFLYSKEKSIRNRMLLENAIKSLKEYDKATRKI